MSRSSFGIIGLGVMGRNLALNILDKGHALSVYNRVTKGEEHLLKDFIYNHSGYDKLQGFSDLQAFINSLETPRTVLLMIKAGNAIDEVINTILPFLSEGDIIIDGGNSHFKDTARRTLSLNDQSIHFIGCGISGGEEGARNGPSLMPGGSKEGYNHISSVLISIAAKDNKSLPCCDFIGPDGSGHFVKMIHNGIEYAEMQLLAEVYHLLSFQHTNDEMADLFSHWNDSGLSSYLMEITSQILNKKQEGQFLIDLILDKAGNKGTGSWSSQAAMELGMPTTMMMDAVFARYISAFKEVRLVLGENKKNPTVIYEVEKVKEAYQFGRIINHQQGFDLLKSASEEYGWGLDLSSIARIWTNGCIIRSILMEELVDINKQSDNLLFSQVIQEQLTSVVPSLKETLSQAISDGIPLPTLSSSYQYWLGMTTKRLPANLIQAQRDYFGAHTYQRIDKGSDDYFHTNWSE